MPSSDWKGGCFFEQCFGCLESAVQHFLHCQCCSVRLSRHTPFCRMTPQKQHVLVRDLPDDGTASVVCGEGADCAFGSWAVRTECADLSGVCDCSCTCGDDVAPVFVVFGVGVMGTAEKSSCTRFCSTITSRALMPHASSVSD